MSDTESVKRSSRGMPVSTAKDYRIPSKARAYCGEDGLYTDMALKAYKRIPNLFTAKDVCVLRQNGRKIANRMLELGLCVVHKHVGSEGARATSVVYRKVAHAN